MGRVIEIVKPLLPFLPEVDPPAKGDRVKFETKLFWTVAALLVYLVCSHMPVYGINAGGSGNPWYIMSMFLASSRGTLMELGISPIITSGMIMQLLTGAKIIDYNPSLKEDRQLFNAANKMLGLVITLGEAIAYVLSGFYGDVRDLGAVTALLLIGQLFFAGIIVLTLDDLLSKGWGLGGGINLFIVTNICEGIFWRALSPTTFNGGRGTEFEGALIATVHMLFTRSNKLGALYDAFARSSAPNLTNLLATALVFLVVIYIQGFKVTIPLVSTVQRGAPAYQYPIKLFYTSNMPIILLTALVSNLYFFSQLLHKRYAANVLVRLLGRWQELPSGQQIPVGGLAYYISPPRSLLDVFSDPFHAAFYIVFMLSCCALFAKTWIEISGQGVSDVAKQLREQKLDVREERAGGTGRNLEKKLRGIIPVAAAFGGVCVGALSIGADLLGAIGSGTGILMAVTIIHDLYEKTEQELRADPSLAKSMRAGGMFSSFM